jgi:SAM-dependent methyltransferase
MNKILTLHNQYQRQAAWTRGLRLFVYRKVHLARKTNILELGCGTGVILDEISRRTGARVCGIDQDREAVAFAKKIYPALDIEKAKAGRLPFPDESFDLIVTHCFWLWQRQPGPVISECRRILKKGGQVAVLAEPDYPNRRDEPEELAGLKNFYIKALIRLGAAPETPGRLEDLMSRTGYRVESGRQDNCWGWEEHLKEFEAEWKFIHNLCGSGRKLAAFKTIDREAIGKKTRRSWMPVLWVVGTKSK